MALASNSLGTVATQDLEHLKFGEAGTVGSGTIAVRTLVLGSGGTQVTSFGATTQDQSTFNSGTTQGGIAMGVYQTSPTTLSNNQAAAVGVDVNRNVKVVEQYAPGAEDNIGNVYGVLPKAVAGTVSTSYGASSYKNLGGSVTDTIATVATYIYSIYATNVNAAIRYLQFHDITTGTIPTGGTPRYSYLLPGGTTVLDRIFSVPLPFGTGCAAGWSSVAGTMAPGTNTDHTLLVQFK